MKVASTVREGVSAYPVLWEGVRGLLFHHCRHQGIEFDIPEIELKENEQIEHCEAVLSAFPEPPEFKTLNQGECYYNPIVDQINMPRIEQFDSAQEYYNVIFHEAIHATGHAKRLGRHGIVELAKFKSQAYSEEELIAELDASFLCGLTKLIEHL